jgi:hypothetical protein
LSRSCPADRPARLRKLNHSLLSRYCRLAGLPNLDSRPLIGNSVRRAGSNSPPRSGPRSELRRGPGPKSVHSFFVRFERSSPGSAGFRKVHFSGRAGGLRGIALVIPFVFWRSGAAAGLSPEMYFMLVRVPFGRKPADVHSRNCRNATKVCAAVSAAIKL